MIYFLRLITGGVLLANLACAGGMSATNSATGSSTASLGGGTTPPPGGGWYPNPGDPDAPEYAHPFTSLLPQREIWVAPYGSDANPGTLFSPKATIAAALASATPGTAVMVKAGNYAANIDITQGGALNQPVWVRSADGRGGARVQGVRVGSGYLIIEGMHIQAGLLIEGANEVPPTGVVLQNNIFSGLLGPSLEIVHGTGLYIFTNDFNQGSSMAEVLVRAGNTVLLGGNCVYRTNWLASSAGPSVIQEQNYQAACL